MTVCFGFPTGDALRMLVAMEVVHLMCWIVEK